MNILTRILWIMALTVFMVNMVTAKPTITIDNVVNPSCTGGDGEIMISVTGGVPPYTYVWSNGATTQDLTGINAGDYTCTVTDASSQVGTNFATLVANGNINVGATIMDATHCNSHDGMITTNVSGGSGNYSYNWSTGSSNTMISNLKDGSYFLTVLDGQCQIAKAYTVHAGEAFVISASTVNESAVHAGDGMIDLSVFGGNNVTYTWSNGATTQDLTAVSAGTYCVTVDDPGIGCPMTECFSITDLNVSGIVLVDAQCTGGTDGRIEMNTAGGNPPYSFAWSNGMNTEDIFGIAAGSYSCTVTDNHGNSISSSFSISDPAPISVNVNKKNEKVDNSSDGRLDVTVTGGNAPYTYLWSNGATTEDIDNLSFGNYCVTITDANGCDQIVCEFINTINAPPFSIDDKNISGKPADVKGSNYIGILSNGTTLDVAPGGNLNPKRDSETNPNFTNPMVYPNPAHDIVNIDVNTLGSRGPVKVEVFDANGRLVISQSFGSGDAKTVKIDVTSVPDGIYLIQLTSVSGWYNERLIIAH